LDGLASGTAPISYQWQKDGLAIAGETDTYYSPAGEVQTSDAGSYTLVAHNAVGSITSAPAILTVIATPPNDMFSKATVITGTNVTATGYNWSATTEPREPWLGIGQSVWWRWTAPSAGAVLFDITNSVFKARDPLESGGSFDGILGVYVGNVVSNLVPVYLDMYPSGLANLFVQKGVTYQIAVDSAAGDGGRIALGLRYIKPQAPTFTSQPQSTTNVVGSWAYFSAEVDGTGPFSFQWQLNGVNIGGATNTDYFISSVQTSDAGIYDLVAKSAAGTNVSSPAVLTVVP
jgi:hypothetical protein